MSFWYKKQLGEDVHSEIFLVTSKLDDDYRVMSCRSALYNAAYSGRDNVYFSDWNITSTDLTQMLSSIPIIDYSENVIQPNVDTVNSIITKNRVAVQSVTRRGEFKTYKSSRLLNLYLYGLFSKSAYQVAPISQRDSLISPVGVMKVVKDDNNYCVERVHPDEIIVDQSECLSGLKPHQLFHRRLVHRDTVLSWNLDKKVKEKIENSQRKGDWKYSTFRTPSDRDMVIVIEAYYIGPAGRKRAVVVENCTLKYEEYDYSNFPFVFLWWRKPVKGFYGYSLVEQIIPRQVRLNNLNDTIQKGQELYCVPRTWTHEGVQIQKEQFDNELGRIYTWKGDERPVTDIWPGAGQELYTEREREISRIREDIGISDYAATASLPNNARLDSSKAIRELTQQPNNKFILQAQDYENCFLQIAEIIIERSAKDKDLSSVYSRKGNLFKEINWKDIDLSRNDFDLTLEPASTLNMTPAARRDEVNFLLSSQLSDPKTALQLLHNPEIDKFYNRKNIFLDTIETHIDKLLDGKSVSPSIEMDLNLCVEIATSEFNRLLQYDDVPDDILILFNTYIAQATYLINQTQQVIQQNVGTAEQPTQPTQ